MIPFAKYRTIIRNRKEKKTEKKKTINNLQITLLISQKMEKIYLSKKAPTTVREKQNKKQKNKKQNKNR